MRTTQDFITVGRAVSTALVVLLCAVFPAIAGEGEEIRLKVDSIGVVRLTAKDLTKTANWQSLSLGVWHPGVWRWMQDDKPDFALPNYNDAAWRLVQSITIDSLQPDWARVFWFRSRIRIDSALRHTSVAMMPYQVGGAEYYLNGRLVATLGNPSSTSSEEVIASKGKPVILQFGAETDYVIAVRYSFRQMPMGYAVVPAIKNNTLFNLSFAPPDEALDMQRAKESYFSVRYLIAIGMMVALGLLHIALFSFYPKQRFHLLYAIFALLVGLRFLTVYMTRIVESHPGISLFFNMISNVYNSAIPLVCWLFFYTLFYDKLPLRRLYLGAGLTVAVIIALFAVGGGAHKIVYDISMVIIVLLSADAARIAFQAVRRREAGAIIMLIGVADFGVMWTFRWLEAWHKIFAVSPNRMETFIYVGYMSVPLAMSLYIALVVSRTQRSLEEQLVHVRELSERSLEQERQAKELDIKRKLLEADNDRKTRELEEARTLQLSMLPSKLPEHPRYEVAAFMRTATEVGGDYYDFRYTPETATLVAAVGDATGHGIKAGYLVSTTKSYFQTLAGAENGAELLCKISSGIKNMNLRGMYMCLALVRCIGNDVHIAIAGMPPVLIYRAKSRSLEQICVKALPLGSVTHFEYREVLTTLDVDDVMLIMTDGLPELFNDSGEMLGYDRIESCFLANAHRSPVEITNLLKGCAEDWMQGAALLDDMTFVVLKMKALPLHHQPLLPSQQSTPQAVFTGKSRIEAMSV